MAEKIYRIVINKKGETNLAGCPVCRKTDIFWVIGEIIPRHGFPKICEGSEKKAVSITMKTNIVKG